MALTPSQEKLQAQMAADAGLSVAEWRRRVGEELMIQELHRRGMGWMADMARCTPTDMLRDIAMRDNRAPTGPSAQGIVPSSQTLSNVRGAGGAKTGDWGTADKVYLQPANVSRGTNQRTWEERMRWPSDEQSEKKT